MPELKLKKKNQELELVEERDSELMNKAIEFFSSTSFGMSELQIRKFVINKLEYPTAWSKWRQAKIEMWIRYQNIINMHFDYREAIAKIDLERAKIANWIKDSDELLKAKVKLSQIEIDRNKFKINVIKKQVKDVIKEMGVFYDIVKEEEPNITSDEKIEDEKFWKEKIKRRPQEFKERYDITL